MVMNAMQAERAAALANQPGPNNERANTPNAAQPICATNILYFLAAGEPGALNSTQQTAPRGAIVKETPLYATTWSSFPSTAMAKNAPAEGQSTSLMLTPPGDTGVTLAAAAASATTRRPLRPRRPKPIASPALTEAGERPVVLVPPLARRRGGGRGACDAAARHCCTLARAGAMPLQPMPGRLWHCSRAILPQSPASLSLSL